MEVRSLVTAIRLTTAAMLVAGILVAPVAASAEQGPPYLDGPTHTFGEMVDYPLTFPVGGEYYMYDTFYAPRCCGEGVVHHAQDIMAAKMTPVYAASDGTISYVNWSSDPAAIDPARCCTLAIRHDDGWESWYIHLNNDTPGTDDGLAWGIAPGILPGAHVQAGELIGWVGDSGNAEDVDPHLHFELHDPDNVYVNPYQALLDAATETPPASATCRGLTATIVGDSDGDGTITGTDGDDVIVGTMGDDVIIAGGGNDTICGLEGADTIDGGAGQDRIEGGPGNDVLLGGRGRDLLVPGIGDDTIAGGSGKDKIRSGRGANVIDGGGGRDQVDYRDATGPVTVYLGLGSTSGDSLASVENVRGSGFDDVIVGDAGNNRLKGGGGNDTISGAEGDDRLIGNRGIDTGDGGAGSDSCAVELPTACEA